MKKTLLGLAAVGAMLVATSCSNEEFANPAGKAGKIQFNVGIEQSLGTRAMNDGSLANELTYAIYNAEGTEVVVPNNTANIENGTVSVTNELQAGKYLFVAWAQNEDCEAYDVTDLAAVEVDFDNVANNDEALDAFCGSQEFEVDGDGTVSVSLQRPFAQINFGWAKAVDYTTSAVEVTGMLSSKLNVVTGTVGPAVQTTLNFTANAVPTEPLGVTLNSEEQEFTYLAMSYVLVNQKSDVDYTITLTGDNGQTEYTVDNVPVQTNYRTNILGDVQSGEITFQVSINAAYAGDNLAFKDVVNVESISAIAARENDTQTGLILTASYTPANATITSADFILTPASAAEMMMRAAEDGVVTVEATAENGFLTAEVLYTALEPNATYTVTATATAGSYEPVESTPGESEGDVTVTVPDEEPTPEPGDGYIYVVGEGDGLGWDFPGLAVEGTDDVYTFTVSNLSKFKISTVEATNWDDFDSGAYSTGETLFTNAVYPDGQTLPIESWGQDQLVPYTGDYTITVDLKKMTMTAVTTTAPPTSIYIAGPDTMTVNGESISYWALPGYEVEETSSGIYTFTLGNASSFKLSTSSSSDWTLFDGSAYASSTSFSNAVATSPGQTLSLVQSTDNQRLPWEGNYTITVNMNDKTITAYTDTPEPKEPQGAIIVGAMSDSDWSYNANYVMTYNSDKGNYTWTGTIPASTEFKIAGLNKTGNGLDWNGDNNWSSNGSITVGGGTEVNCFYNTGNMTLTSAFTGTLTLKVNSSTSATLTFEPSN